jgi:hypothetical protein
MSKTNTLISHHGESSNSRADKMSGMTEACREWSRGKSKKEYKKFFSKKRRQFLKNEKFFDKI